MDQPEDGREVAQAGDGGDLKTEPKAPHSTTLSQAEEAMVVAFQRHAAAARRLLEPIGNIPPAEAEQQYYALANIVDTAA